MGNKLSELMHRNRNHVHKLHTVFNLPRIKPTANFFDTMAGVGKCSMRITKRSLHRTHVWWAEEKYYKH